MPTGPKPLDGFRVLDFTQNVAGPLAGQVLADLGAEVIKVEAPAGDASRHITSVLPGRLPLAVYFLPNNRGKKSVQVDLRTPEARQQIPSRSAPTRKTSSGYLAGVDLGVKNPGRPDSSLMPSTWGTRRGHRSASSTVLEVQPRRRVLRTVPSAPLDPGKPVRPRHARGVRVPRSRCDGASSTTRHQPAQRWRPPRPAETPAPRGSACRLCSVAVQGPIDPAPDDNAGLPVECRGQEVVGILLQNVVVTAGEDVIVVFFVLDQPDCSGGCALNVGSRNTFGGSVHAGGGHFNPIAASRGLAASDRFGQPQGGDVDAPRVSVGHHARCFGADGEVGVRRDDRR